MKYNAMKKRGGMDIQIHIVITRASIAVER
jgi:hypothetical protein